MADIISRIADFLQDVPIRSEATGMFIERDDLRSILEEHNDLERARLRDRYKERPSNAAIAASLSKTEEAYLTNVTRKDTPRPEIKGI